jgi:hypothetical protein
MQMVALSGLSLLPIREGCRVFGAGVGAPAGASNDTELEKLEKRLQFAPLFRPQWPL